MKGLSQPPGRFRGLNLFEVIGLLLIVGGLAYGFTRGLERGIWEGVLGALIGGGVAWLVFAAMMLVILLPFLLIFAVYRPQFPLCAAGRCRDSHYGHLGEHEMPELRARLRAAGKEVWLVRYACGTLYCSSLTEQRFFQVIGEGELHPFMRYRPYRR